ncbi:MAG: hypothetical protein KAT65_22305 [Methanophagales archaeon]|nr:hypothetical protein [Methanophagales archaeon]
MQVIEPFMAKDVVYKLLRIQEEIEELIEELEILSDEERAKDIEESKKDFEEGKYVYTENRRRDRAVLRRFRGRMTKIELSEKFKSQLRKVKDEAIRDSVEKTFKDLLEDPNIGKTLTYKNIFRCLR